MSRVNSLGGRRFESLNVEEPRPAEAWSAPITLSLVKFERGKTRSTASIRASGAWRCATAR